MQGFPNGRARRVALAIKEGCPRRGLPNAMRGVPDVVCHKETRCLEEEEESEEKELEEEGSEEEGGGSRGEGSGGGGIRGGGGEESEEE